jgi:hypothetical protein
MTGSNRWRRLSARLRLTLAVGALVLWSAGESQAGGLIPFSFDPSRPTILATDGSVTYDASTGDFNVQATGLFFLSLHLPGGVPDVPITNDSAVIDLTLDQSGNLVAPGTLKVTGAIDINQDGINDVSGTLVTGTVTAFGAAAGGQAPWEFNGLFNFTGGLLTQPSITLSGGGTFTDLFKLSDTGGFDLVVEQQVSGILGNFLSSFSGKTSKGVVVGVVVPEPGSAVLLLVGTAAVAVGTRLRRFGARPRLDRAA